MTDNECVVCLAAKRDTFVAACACVLPPCCTECAPKLDACPLCRAKRVAGVTAGFAPSDFASLYPRLTNPGETLASRAANLTLRATKLLSNMLAGEEETEVDALPLNY